MLVLPEPVGPVNRSRPLVRFSTRSSPWSVESSKPRRAQLEAPVAGIEQPHDDLLAARGGEDRHAQLDAVQFRAADGGAVLRRAGLVGHEVGHDLEAHRDLVHEVERQMGDLGEHAVNAGAHGDGGFPGLDVQVAGAEADGVLDQAVDEHADLEALGGQFRLEILNRVTHIKNLMAWPSAPNVSPTGRSMSQGR